MKEGFHSKELVAAVSSQTSLKEERRLVHNGEAGRFLETCFVF